MLWRYETCAVLYTTLPMLAARMLMATRVRPHRGKAITARRPKGPATTWLSQMMRAVPTALPMRPASNPPMRPPRLPTLNTTPITHVGESSVRTRKIVMTAKVAALKKLLVDRAADDLAQDRMVEDEREPFLDLVP